MTTLEAQDRVLEENRRILAGRKAGGIAEKVDEIVAQSFGFTTQAQLNGLIGGIGAVQSLSDLPSV